jgi:hypothetical protein
MPIVPIVPIALAGPPAGAIGTIGIGVEFGRVLPDRAAPTPAVQPLVLSDLNMMVRTGGGERTAGEFSALLAGAGLRLVRVVPTGGPVSLVEATPA